MLDGRNLWILVAALLISGVLAAGISYWAVPVPIIQMEPVSERLKTATLRAAVYEGQEPVTDIQTVKFDSASGNLDERKKWVSLAEGTGLQGFDFGRSAPALPLAMHFRVRSPGIVRGIGPFFSCGLDRLEGAAQFAGPPGHQAFIPLERCRNSYSACAFGNEGSDTLVFFRSPSPREGHLRKVRHED
jgi:hypothetical protein